MLVADTNLIAYQLIDGPFTDDAKRVLGRDPNWCAPPQWQAELLSVLLRSVRYTTLTLEFADEAYRRAKALVRTRERPHFRRILDLALASGCSTYDCEFVALAINKRVPLVTNDKKVLRAFPGVAVSLADFGK